MAEKQVYEVTVDIEGNIFWHRNGELHRLDGPAIEWTYGVKNWYQNDKLHRLDGPAVESVSGHKQWYQNGFLHRIGGPAIEWVNGDKSWFKNGKLHRLDGPAIEYADGSKQYWIEGVWHSQQEYITKIAKMKAASEPSSCAGKIVTIDGKQYKLMQF